MTAVELPAPVLRAREPAEVAGPDVAALERDLRAGVDGEVRFDAGSRGAYSTDASNFRQVPIGVVVPRTVEAGAAAVAVCVRHRAPIVSRGGGTSLAGECTNVAVVIDWSKYCHRLLSVDPTSRTCVVEPGAVLDVMNDQLRGYDLEFGPEPATHDHCTIGGMIGNNSCGATAQRTGKVVDNIVELEVLLTDGTRMWVGATSDEAYERIQAEGGRRAQLHRQLRALRDTYLADIRTRYPHIPRRVSGYNLDSLLPEYGFHVAQALVGSEGTCVTVLRAKLRLVPRVHARTAVLLGYPDIAAAADAVPAVLEHEPIALEGLDSKLVHYQREKHLNAEALQRLPKGAAYLLVQLGGEDPAAVERRTAAFLDGLGKRRDDEDVAVFDDEAIEAQIWMVRESGLGATARVPGLPDTWPGWEDSAVAPEHLGDYLRELQELYREFGYEQASIYGHFGQGCVHTRIPFELTSGAGIARYREFMERAGDLVVSYGGSFSGEHGDGQQRGELLPKMFGDRVMEAFGRFKAIFDPDDLMNPGKVVPAYPLDSHLRIGVDYDHGGVRTAFAYPNDDGSFGRAVLRCVGVGACRHHDGGVMCPSYMATHEEEHSTRGRARLLFEMLDGGARGGAVTDGWRSTAVRDALDLCLACKGCLRDCPVSVDMATYKAEFLAHHYAHRLRPRAHYAMGWLPVWAALASRAPRAVNALLHAPGVERLALTVAGIDRLWPDDEDVHKLAAQMVTLAELLQEHTPGWTPPQLHRSVHVQTHCHQHAVLGNSADTELLHRAGLDVDVLDSGCCGLAGNFGFEQGHYDVSEACAERVLLPAIRRSAPGDVVLADGFSCRTQIEQGDAGGRRAVHLAELLRAGLRGDTGEDRPEQSWAVRPAAPGRRTAWAVTAAAVAVGTASVSALIVVGADAAVRRLRRR